MPIICQLSDIPYGLPIYLPVDGDSVAVAFSIMLKIIINIFVQVFVRAYFYIPRTHIEDVQGSVTPALGV